jgi:co-chaperonin GroES (HSP10)
MLQATQKRCIIKAIELVKESAGGIILKTTDATQFAEIISVGPQVEDPLPVGTTVVVDWNHTVPIKHEDQQYYVIDSRAIAAVLEQ